MLMKLATHLGEYRRAAIITPCLSALEAIMDVLLPSRRPSGLRKTR